MYVRSSGCKEHKHAHSNMVLVHDRSQESSSINLLEVDMGDQPRTRPFFFLAELRSRIFISLGEKKVGGEKKSESKSSKRSQPPSRSEPNTFFVHVWSAIDCLLVSSCVTHMFLILVYHAHTRVMFVRMERQSLCKKVSLRERRSSPPFFACMVRNRSLYCDIACHLLVSDSHRSCTHEDHVCLHEKYSLCEKHSNCARSNLHFPFFFALLGKPDGLLANGLEHRHVQALRIRVPT
jgi:hypothetical protein